MKKLLSLVLALVLCLGMLCANAEDPMKIALILPGAKDDVSFNQAMYEAMMVIIEEYGDAIEVSIVENVYDVADIKPALIDYAESGYDLVFGHGFQFMDPIMELCEDYPETIFVTGTGYLTADNAGYYNTHLASGGYIMGVIAALATESNKLGVVGGCEVSEIHQGHAGYKAGAKFINPDIEIQEVYTNDFNDVALAKTTADGMYADGVDVIWHSGDGVGLGVVNSALENNKFCLTNAADQSGLAPENVVSGVIYHWEAVIRQIIEDVKAGTFSSGSKEYWCNVENGGVEIGTLLPGALTDEEAAQVAQLIADIQSGAVVIPMFD